MPRMSRTITRTVRGPGRNTVKLDAHPELRRAVVDGLNGRFSPQQVAGRLPVLFPGREDMRVSHETIYQALYVQGKGGVAARADRAQSAPVGADRSEPAVETATQTGTAMVGVAHGSPTGPRKPPIGPCPDTGKETWSSDRPKSGIVTLVERNSRFALIGRLPGGRDSDTVNEVMTRMIETLPAALMKTITWDQGTEMAGHAKFTVKTGCPVFFCDPHSPWQRGTNENTNGLIRDFYPKGTNFNTITDDDIAETQRLLNIRPRATLDFATPAEKLDEHIKRVALTT